MNAATDTTTAKEQLTLSLVSHTNVGKTTLARTLLRRDVGEILDQAHVTDVSEAHTMVESADARLVLWDTPGFGDTARLLKRLKLASPAHPVLLFRALFLLMAMGAVAAVLAVLVVPMVNADWARTLAKFDAVVPAPPGIPGLPALLGLLCLCMVIGYGMTTMAALAMGCDSQMLPWEQKQHQKQHQQPQK